MKNEINGHRPEQHSSEDISKIVEHYRASGLGVVAFAKKQGIPPGRMHYWVYQKRGKSRPPTSSRRASQPIFQEVNVAAMVAGAGCWAAEVNLSSGVGVRFSAAATPQWIGSVVQALQRPC
jgi:hypothetical protein